MEADYGAKSYMCERKNELVKMRAYARSGEYPPDGFMCPGGWEVLVKHYESVQAEEEATQKPTAELDNVGRNNYGVGFHRVHLIVVISSSFKQGGYPTMQSAASSRFEVFNWAGFQCKIANPSIVKKYEY
ncbi:hypothetical protein RJ640_003601 [Escallonia rubra]|uniref:Uncharacterized protein n=1 Tax=Escallonia rubra TaxID=112253 RepID=A0AA88UM96_9ASTE|nr:hypothetical protein RJ640_003601 [Escallonia rubra]